MAQESMEVTSESDCEIFSEDSKDEYNLQVTVAVTENERDEIEEFTDALSEIHGEKSFPCSECGKVCKSKGGLTRHINSKHSNTQIEYEVSRISHVLLRYDCVDCGID